MKPHRLVTALSAAAAALSGCDFPTGLPEVEQRWIVPVDETALSVSEFLPDGVTIQGNQFSVLVDPFATNRSLGQLCGACTPLNGQVAPVPAFNGTFSVNQDLPADVLAAQLSSGVVRVVIHNGFAFDPLAGGGRITVAITNGPGGNPLGQAVLAGPAQSIAPSGSSGVDIPLQPGAVGSTLTVRVEVDVVGGQNALINTAELLTATATPQALTVGSATVRVANRVVDFDELELERLDAGLLDRVQQGAIIFDVQNPFGVSLSGQIRITYDGVGSTPGGLLDKAVSISAQPTSTVSIQYSGDELRSFLRKPSDGEEPPNPLLSGRGTVSVPGGSITVTPGQQMVLKAKLDVTLRVGG